ncbi:MAG: EB domain-containing protein [Myxococcota bacterium]|nr:EB domain-containing protein [Myxococcota bacterium]
MINTLFFRKITYACVIFLATLASGCRSAGKCTFNSDCENGQVCSGGACIIPCEMTEECPMGQMCLEGQCGTPPAMGDACVLEAGCPDAAMDAAIDDQAEAGMMPNMMTPDAAARQDMAMAPMTNGNMTATLDMAMQPAQPAPDMGINSTPDFGSTNADGGSGPAATGLNLSGTYSVLSKVLVVTGGMLEEEMEIRHVAQLEVLAGTRYRLSVFDLDGVLQYRIPNLDMATPEGAGRYQYEYERRSPERMDCDRLETYFERGRYEMGVFGFRLLGTQDRRSELAGERCQPMPFIVKLETVWTALP